MPIITMKINCNIGISWVMMLLLGVTFTFGLPSSGWGSSDVTDETICEFTDSQIQNLLDLLEKCTQSLEGLSTLNILSKAEGKSYPINKCDQYLKKIELGLVNVASEALRLKEAGTDTVGMAEKIRKLEDANLKISIDLQNLIRQHKQELAHVKNKFNQLIQQYKADVTRLSNELRKTQEELFKGKLDRIVLRLKHEHESVEDAIEIIKYFFDRDRKENEKLAGKMVRNAISQVYSFKGMQLWGKLMLFIDKLPNWNETFEGYEQLLNEMSPLLNKNADILLKFAYKIKIDLVGETRWSSTLKNLFPKTIRDLIWHNHCHLKNEKYAHYMKVVSEDQHGTTVYHMVGENNTSGDSHWRLNPYQTVFPDGQVKFRVENVGTSRYLKDFGAVEFASTVGTADSSDSKWQVKFANNRVTSDTEKSEFYLYAPEIKKYLYESNRFWEPWRCGFNQWLDCAVISQEEDKMYDDGKWVLDCSV